MEEDVNKTQTVAEEQGDELTARQELEALLNEMVPEEKRTDNVEQMALDWIIEQRDMNSRLVSAMSDDPRMAQVFAEVMNGGKGAVALVRHFGKGFLEAKEGSPEYEEMMAADKALMDERAAIKQREEEYKTKIEQWFDALEGYLEKNGLDKERYLTEIEDAVVIPSLDLVADDKLFARLVKAVDYDKDVEDAFEAGNIKGRNTNINEMRAKQGDGMPKGLGSAAKTVEKPKTRMNSLIAKALQA